MLMLMLTQGRDCICWKLLLECPKALWEVHSNFIKFVSNSCKTSKKKFKQSETKWQKSSEIKDVEDGSEPICVLGTKIFSKPAVSAAVIVILKHWNYWQK